MHGYSKMPHVCILLAFKANAAFDGSLSISGNGDCVNASRSSTSAMYFKNIHMHRFTQNPPFHHALALLHHTQRAVDIFQLHIASPLHKPMNVVPLEHLKCHCIAFRMDGAIYKCMLAFIPHAWDVFIVTSSLLFFGLNDFQDESSTFLHHSLRNVPPFIVIILKKASKLFTQHMIYGNRSFNFYRHISFAPILFASHNILPLYINKLLSDRSK